MPPFMEMLRNGFLVSAGVLLLAMVLRWLVPLIRGGERHAAGGLDMDRWERHLDTLRTEFWQAITELRRDNEVKAKATENMMVIMLEKLRREIDDDARRRA